LEECNTPFTDARALAEPFATLTGFRFGLRSHPVSLVGSNGYWRCGRSRHVRIRPQEAFAVEVHHVVGFVGDPHFRFPGNAAEE
jgi:hypothetical protein